MNTQIESILDEHQSVLDQLYDLTDDLSAIATLIVTALKDGKKILLMGNGGSAADCQHIAAELVGRFERDRPGFAALALTTDTSVITAISNDYSFETVFKRQIEALCNEGDVVIGISTSGHSVNIISALEKAQAMGGIPIGFTGQKQSPITAVTRHCLKIPASNTARIQEMHILSGHIICDIVEKTMLQDKQR